MLDKVLLDANSILNATFIPTSWSRLVVSKLVTRKSALYVGPGTLGEATSVARRIAKSLGKRTDPSVAIQEFVRNARGIDIAPSTHGVDPSIPAHDHHVVQEAIAAEATILTSDAQLWDSCNKMGINAVFPLQALRSLDGLSLSTTAFGVRPGRNAGSVFARVFPGNWGGMRGVGRFTVADFSGRLWIYYCSDQQAWVAEMPEVGRLAVGAQVDRDTMQTIAVSWESGKGLRLRVASIETPAETRMRQPLGRDLPDAVSIGHRTDVQDHWFGAIRVCVINDRPISVRSWSMLRSTVDLTPNPYDSDRLRHALNESMF